MEPSELVQIETRSPIRGRGSARNLPNRFEPIHVERDPGIDGEDPRPRTRFYRDASRSIIATNDSPDVGFEASINPYRGCEHGCAYCLHPDTPILHADMTWRPIGAVAVGDALLAFDEFPAPGRTRKLRRSRVEGVWRSRRPSIRLITERREVVTTADHRWLDGRSGRWSFTRTLAPGRTLRHLPVDAEAGDPENAEYRIGYLCGLSLGDGTFRYRPERRSETLGYPAAYWRVALADPEPLHRACSILRELGIAAPVRPLGPGRGSRKMKKVEIRGPGALSRLDRILHTEIPSADYRRGFLGGFVDAEGRPGSSPRFSRTDLRVLERVKRYGASLGFELVLEPRHGPAGSLRLEGGIPERMRFFTACRPAIRGKIESVMGRGLSHAPEEIVSVERGPTADVVDIRTSTGTFYADGLATHNCYARPWHEYLGLSPGLDFETRIFVKEDAPALLREELAAEGWEPKTLVMSGVTDPYQPVERRLGITRGCLEVLAEVRNPVSIVTKNHLVTRDADLLRELAAGDAARVTLSITTLRNELQRTMEPRTCTPARRLDAVERLAEAGVPVGVFVAPVIPGLTDHEIPEILRAAADAGASHAGYVMLRLPHGVADLFREWLGRHVPGRKEKVLNRLRSLRDGELNDPRFGSRMKGTGPFAEQVREIFRLARRKAGIPEEPAPLSAAGFRPPPREGQLELFGEAAGRPGGSDAGGGRG